MMTRLIWVVLMVFGVTLTALADVDELVKKLGSKDNEERRNAAKELGQLGKKAAPAVGALTMALKDSDSFVRKWCADALGEIGEEAKSSIPALTALLNDGKAPVRVAAINALAKMGKDALPGLTKAVSGADDLHETAVKALVKMGSEAVPALTTAIKGKMSAELRQKSIEAVVKQGKEGRPALTVIFDTAKNPRAQGQEGNQLRLTAIAALGTLATKEDKDIVKSLDAIVKNEKEQNKQLKAAAEKALKEIEAKPTETKDK